MAAMEQGQYREGLAELQQATDLEPRDVRYRGDWLRAREEAQRKLLAQAEAALADGRDEQAAEAYRTIQAFDRDSARARAGLERIELRRRAAEDVAQAREARKRGDTAIALQLINRALEAEPNQPEAKAAKRELETLAAKEMLTAPTLGAIYRKPINLEFRDASLKMVFEALSRTTGINFIFDRDVRNDQRTTVFLKQTTLEDAVDVILTTNRLDKKILNPTSVLIYPSDAGKAKEYQDLVVRAFYLSSAEAKQTANLLKTVLKLQNVFVDDKLNMLVLRETPETITLAEKLIALHDLDDPEVMLEVEVLEVKRSRLLDLGIKVTDQLTVSPLGVATDSGSGTSGSSSSQVMRLSDLRNLNSNRLGVNVPSATVTFRKEDGDANLLANPRIRVRDREKAKILIGDKVPVVTTTTTSTGFLSENVQLIDVGLKLEVEPTVYLRDEIGIKVGLEVSSLVSTIKTSTGTVAYQIGTRSANSVLRLRDGETQVLAGLISDEDRSAANRIPLLGDLPLLGRLFSSQKDDRQKTEIVLSITPHLIRNIQRKEPTAESFWSGTESALRTRPLQLRSMDAASLDAPKAASPQLSSQASPAAQVNPVSPPPAADNGNLKLSLQGPAKVKVGETLRLAVELDSKEALRAAPLQLAYDPKVFAAVQASDGGYFGKAGSGSFSHVIDAASGRISIGASSGDAAGAKGPGRLCLIEFRALNPQQGSEISLIGMTPIGAAQPASSPALPLVHAVDVAE
ncbi:cohesin domain-containing protein [Chitinimonas koreensis]|nr:cohesin domain-containing protein [Chitinimonas koreensis]QNM94825.1 general secretion pathway protein GspD [Chitinimonas koreensis]